MDPKFDIHKAAGVLIKDRKLLVVKSKHYHLFISPGGKIDAGETAEQALVRELNEELGIAVAPSDFEYFMTAHDQTTHTPPKTLKMDVFWVKSWQGDLVPANEIETLAWVDMSSDLGTIGAAFSRHVMPVLKERNLID